MNNKVVYSYWHGKEIFYIGKGSVKRSKRTNSGRSNWCQSKINKAKKENKFRIVILKKNLSDLESLNYEKRYIAHYGRKDLEKGTLVNLTDGGEFFEGYTLTKEQREKQANKIRGRRITEETREKMSKAQSGRIHTRQHIQSRTLSGKDNGMYGKTHTAKARAKISKSRQKVFSTPKGTFTGVTEAATANNISDSAAYKRMSSKNFTDWFYIG